MAGFFCLVGLGFGFCFLVLAMANLPQVLFDFALVSFYSDVTERLNPELGLEIPHPFSTFMTLGQLTCY